MTLEFEENIVHITIFGAFSKIEGDADWPKVYEACSYKVAGAEYSKAYRRGLWNGITYLINKKTQSFPSGLVNIVQKVCEEAGKQVFIHDHRKDPGSMGVFHKGSFDLNTHKMIGKYEYQLEACKTAVDKQQGIIKIATGGGKGSIIAALVSYLQLPTLIIVPSVELLHQTRKVLLEQIPYIKDKDVGTIGDGDWVVGDLVTVAILDSLESRFNTEECKELLDNVDVLINDECHAGGSETYYDVMSACNAWYRYGFSVGPESRIEVKDLNGKIISCTIQELYLLLNKGVLLPGFVSMNGYQVRSHDGNKFKWVNLKGLDAHKCVDKKCFKIKTTYGRSLLVTEDHSVFKVSKGLSLAEEARILGKATGKPSTTGKKIKYIPELEQVKGSDIKPGDFLLLSDQKWETDVSDDAPLGISKKDWAIFCGLYIGNGWLDKGKVCFSFHKDKVSKVLAILAPIKDLLSLNISSRIRNNSNGTEIVIYSKLLEQSVRSMNIGYNAPEKRIPNWIWSQSEDVRYSLLEGLKLSDGSVHKSNKYNCVYSTTSKRLYEDLIVLLSSLGIVSSKLTPQLPRLGGIIRGKQVYGRHPRYAVYWSLFRYKGPGRFPSCFVKNRLEGLPVRVTSVEEVEAPELVYDFVSTDTSSFMASDFLVHNSGTPIYRTDGANLKVIALFGDIIVDISYKYLIENKVLPKPKIIFDKIAKPGLAGSKLKYNTVYSEAVVKNKYLTEKIVEWTKICVDQGLSVLILIDQIQHGKLLDAALWGEGSFISHTFISGQADDKDNRKEGFEAFDKREIPVLIASSILDVGVSTSSIDVLICAGSRKSKIKTLQRLGRALRGEKAIVIEFANYCHKFLLEHSLTRLRDYKAEDCFDIVQSGPDAELIKRLWAGGSK